MQINIIIIDKKSKDKLYSGLIEYYIKIAKPFAKINVIEVFDKEIAKTYAKGGLLYEKIPHFRKSLDDVVKLIGELK